MGLSEPVRPLPQPPSMAPSKAPVANHGAKSPRMKKGVNSGGRLGLRHFGCCSGRQNYAAAPHLEAALPYICRLTAFSRFTCPSVGPLLHPCDRPAITAARSRVSPCAKPFISGRPLACASAIQPSGSAARRSRTRLRNARHRPLGFSIVGHRRRGAPRTTPVPASRSPSEEARWPADRTGCVRRSLRRGPRGFLPAGRTGVKVRLRRCGRSQAAPLRAVPPCGLACRQRPWHGREKGDRVDA